MHDAHLVFSSDALHTSWELPEGERTPSQEGDLPWKARDVTTASRPKLAIPNIQALVFLKKKTNSPHERKTQVRGRNAGVGHI